MPLECLVPGHLWHATQPLRFGPFSITTRMTVVRLQDGSLWVHSPIAPTRELTGELAALGRVRYVIAPNRSHHLFFLPFLAEHPSAGGYIAPGLESKRPGLKSFPRIPETGPWGAELRGFFMSGLPVINETAWFHEATGTLILTDLLFCFSRRNRGLTAAVARLLGVYGNLEMSRTMKLMVRDEPALRRSVASLLSLPVARIVVAHDEVIREEPAAKLARALAWLDARAHGT